MKSFKLEVTIKYENDKWACWSVPKGDKTEKYVSFAYGDTKEEAIVRWAKGISNDKCSYWNL